MNLESFRDYCLGLPGVTEDFPFDADTLAFRIGGKIFCLLSVSQPDECNLKCDPERAIVLREQYEAVRPGYHMNKKHWNTVRWNTQLGDRQLLELTLHSYELVKNSLPKAQRLQIDAQ